MRYDLAKLAPAKRPVNRALMASISTAGDAATVAAAMERRNIEDFFDNREMRDIRSLMSERSAVHC